MNKKMITKRSYLNKLYRVCFLQVDCKELFYRDLPTLDDSLADKLLPGCTTLKEVMNTGFYFQQVIQKKCFLSL